MLSSKSGWLYLAFQDRQPSPFSQRMRQIKMLLLKSSCVRVSGVVHPVFPMLVPNHYLQVHWQMPPLWFHMEKLDCPMSGEAAKRAYSGQHRHFFSLPQVVLNITKSNVKYLTELYPELLVIIQSAS